MTLRKCLAGLTLFAATAFNATAHAALTINVTDAGAGNTNWIFTSTPGSLTIGADTFGTAPTGNGNFFTDLANSPYTTIPNQTSFTALSGLATITIGAESTSLSTILVDFDGVNRDDLGIAGIAPIVFAAGEKVTWSGSLLMPIAFADLIPGTYGPALSQGGLNNTPNNVLPADLTLIIGAASTIPEPATASLGLLGMGGLMLRRRRMV